VQSNRLCQFRTDGPEWLFPVPADAHGLAFAAADRLVLFSQTESGSIGYVSLGGESGDWLDPGSLSRPRSICLGPMDLYVQEDLWTVRRIHRGTKVHAPVLGRRSLAVLASLRPRGQLPLHGGNQFCLSPGRRALFWARPEYHRIFRLGYDSLVSVAVGSGHPGFSFCSQPDRSLLCRPSSLACDAQGLLWVADTGNHVLRRFAFTRQTEEQSCWGRPQQEGGRDGAASECLLDRPEQICWQKETLWLVDQGGRRLRRLDAKQGILRTVYESNGAILALAAGGTDTAAGPFFLESHAQENNIAACKPVSHLR
jgi:hypothetical protein